MKETQQYFKRQMAKSKQKEVGRSQIQQITQFTKDIIPQLTNLPNKVTPKERPIVFLNRASFYSHHSRYLDPLCSRYIVRKHKYYVIICAQMINPSHQYILRLQEAEGNQFLSQIDYNYESVIDNLAIKNEKLVIKQIKSKKKNKRQQKQSFIKLKRIINSSHITYQALQQSPSKNQYASDEQQPNISI